MSKQIKSPSFQFYAQDFLTGVMYLNNEEIGIYIKMLAKQWTDGAIPKKRVGLLTGIEWDNFSEELKEKFVEVDGTLINTRLEAEREKKKKFIEKQSINGSKGGRPPKKNKPKQNPIKTQTQTQKKPLEDEDEIEEEVEKEIEIDYEEVKDIFNSLENSFPEIKLMNSSRKSAIKSRAKEHGLETVGLVLQMASNSSFLNGDSEKGFTANFDWIMKPANFLKILEGNYENKKTNKNPNNDDRYAEYKKDIARRLSEVPSR